MNLILLSPFEKATYPERYGYLITLRCVPCNYTTPWLKDTPESVIDKPSSKTFTYCASKLSRTVELLIPVIYS